MGGMEVEGGRGRMVVFSVEWKSKEDGRGDKGGFSVGWMLKEDGGGDIGGFFQWDGRRRIGGEDDGSGLGFSFSFFGRMDGGRWEGGLLTFAMIFRITALNLVLVFSEQQGVYGQGVRETHFLDG